MGGMADEMLARMREDGVDPSNVAAGGAPGSQDANEEPVTPPAGESNADNGNRVPDQIPYARFKEVNDHLQPYKELEGYGYDADSLRRLASFEATYLADPVGTLKSMAETLELPEHIIQALDEHIAGATGGSDDEKPAPTEPVQLPDEIKSRLEYVDQLRARDEDAARNAQLDAVLQAWSSLDEKDEVKGPNDRLKLIAISAAAQSGRNFRTFEELAEAAREEFMGYRNEVLGEAVVRTGRGAPRLPGGPPAPAGPIKFKDLRDASKAAEEDIRQGRLPVN